MPIQARAGGCAALVMMLAATPAAADDPRDVFGSRWQVGGFVYVSPLF
jgi:hypothetical protein